MTAPTPRVWDVSGVSPDQLSDGSTGGGTGGEGAVRVGLGQFLVGGSDSVGVGSGVGVGEGVCVGVGVGLAVVGVGLALVGFGFGFGVGVGVWRGGRGVGCGSAGTTGGAGAGRLVGVARVGDGVAVGLAELRVALGLGLPVDSDGSLEGCDELLGDGPGRGAGAAGSRGDRAHTASTIVARPRTSRPRTGPRRRHVSASAKAAGPRGAGGSAAIAARVVPTRQGGVPLCVVAKRPGSLRPAASRVSSGRAHRVNAG